MSTGSTTGAAGTSGPPIAVDPNTNGLPCEVTALLKHYCGGCHSSPPSGGAPDSLMSYADLVATATLDATQKVGPLSMQLIKNGTMPPKPAAVPTAAELATLEAWVNGGMQKTTCAMEIDAGVAPSPYDTPPKCTSGQNWTGGNHGSSSMRPGGACISCHDMSGGEAPHFTIGGTVYPSAHEPDDCNGTSNSSSGQVSVLITEANGTKHTLTVNGAGNFSYKGTIATPYTAQVNAGSAVRVMTHTQTSGDCNGCHTENGASTVQGATPAPGRIMSP